MSEYSYEIKGIDCADCAAKLENKIQGIQGISNVSLSFMHESLNYTCEEKDAARIEKEMRDIVAKEEEDAVVKAKHIEHAERCGHEEEIATYIFEVKDIDCADCAAKLEEKIKGIKGISNVSLSFMNEKLTYDCAHDEGERIQSEVVGLINREEPDAKVTYRGHQHHHYNEEKLTYSFEVKDIDCADCAAKLEEKIKGIKGISNVSLSFMNEKLTYDCAHDEAERIQSELVDLISREEPDAKVKFLNAENHESSHLSEKKVRLTAKSRKYTVTGIDCADCAAKIEGKIEKLDGISNVSLSFMNSTLVFDAEEENVPRLEKEIQDLLHKEEPEAVMTKYVKQKEASDDDDEDSEHILPRLIIGAILFVIGMFASGTVQIVAELAAYVILGYDVLLKAVKGIGRGQLFDEHFLMAVATIAAIYLQDYREAAGVMLFYQIGEYFQDMAVEKSRNSIGELMNIRPDSAVVQRDGDWVEVEPEDVEIGEIVRVKPGEKIPLDGIVVKGASSLDTSSLTGESKPSDVDVNDEVISGSVNETGVLEIEVTKEFGESTVAKILELVENNESKKAKAENFITKFSRYYTPIVVFSAIAVAIIVSLLGLGVRTGIERACTFLVISCPCALVISIPLSFFAGIGGLSSRGVLVKGANLIETLSKVENVVMDKTGTLTTGTFKVEEILSEKDKNILKDAAYAEYYSNHPIAEGIKTSYGKQIDESKLSDVTEIAGRGISMKCGDDRILAGNYKLMQEQGIECDQENSTGTLVYVAKNGVYEGCLVLKDQLKADAKKAIKELQDAGKKCIIVSGDNQEITDSVKNELRCDAAYGSCMPADKVAKVQEIRQNGITAFVGDGVNDAPVLTAADIGFAMGALGSDAAIEAADIVIMDDSPSKIALAITSAKRILRVVNENIYGAIIIKIVTLILGAFGIANMWWAIFADTGVAMLCVMNSMRLLHIARKQTITKEKQSAVIS